jgi:RHS repeat-associated protein
VASGGAINSGNVFMPKTPEQFSYDADGNLTNDGRWAYTWDAENRLIGITANTPVGPRYQLAFAYDAKGRRIQKVVTNGSAVATTNFLYDGWNLVAELQPNSTPIRTYVWGSDLSGSMQGAGGIGGLLEVSYRGTGTTNCFAAFDGNGNVAALVNAADGTSVANYEYGPFGEVIRSTGPMAKVNPFRFSTEYCDDESDLLYYGNRFYKPSTGTWLSKEPKGEFGFETLESGVSEEDEIEPGSEWNPYRFVKNDAISRTDALGLWPSASPWYGRLLNSGFAIPLTHENSDHRVLPLSASDMATVDAASVFVDNGQGTALSYQHAMRAPGQTRATAKTLANQWVTENLKAAQSLWCPCGPNVNRTVALWFFGTALHAVQDSTSPAHHGFQEWDGLSGWANELKAIAHVEKEEWDPGSGSNLDKATAWMWGFMRCPQPALPTDFFIWKADYSWWYD